MPLPQVRPEGPSRTPKGNSGYTLPRTIDLSRIPEVACASLTHNELTKQSWAGPGLLALLNAGVDPQGNAGYLANGTRDSTPHRSSMTNKGFQGEKRLVTRRLTRRRLGHFTVYFTQPHAPH